MSLRGTWGRAPGQTYAEAYGAKDELKMLDFGYDEPREVTLEPEPIPVASARVIEADATYGSFVVEPLPRGYGVTLGTPMRRVLLNSIQGIAVNWVRIEGIEHEYSTIPHVKEDVVDILLNVKAISLRSLSNRPGKLRLEVQGPGEICAGDIMSSSDFEIVNPELHIATLDAKDSKLIMEMNVEQGTGYEPASSADGLPIGVLPVDAVFTPVRKVNYTVERTRIGQQTDYERLLLEVWTNGAVAPIEAVKQAGHELVEHLFRFERLSEDAADVGSQGPPVPAPIYNMGVENLGLSARTLNCLKRASIHKVGELLERPRAELLRIRNFGERSLEELDEKLAALDIYHPELSPPADSATAAEEGEADVAAADESAGDKDKEE